MNFSLKSFSLIAILVLFLSACGDEDENPNIVTGPAGRIARTYKGVLHFKGDIRENVTLEVVAVGPFSAKFEFVGNNMPKVRLVELMLDEKSGEIISRTPPKGEPVLTRITYDSQQMHLTYEGLTSDEFFSFYTTE